MVTEVASSLLLLTSTSHKWLCFGCQDISHAHVNCPSPPLTLLQMSLLSASHIYMHRGVRTLTHTHQHACRHPIRQYLAHSAFLLPPDWRTEAAREVLRERRVARQNGWSHDEQRSVYKPKAEQSKNKGRKGKASRTRSLNTITDWKRGSLPWQSQLEVGQINTTHADTLVYTRRLCL